MLTQRLLKGHAWVAKQDPFIDGNTIIGKGVLVLKWKSIFSALI